MRKFSFWTIAMLLLGILSGCYGPNDLFKPYPWYRSACWYCEEIDMAIQFTLDEEGNRTGETYSQLLVNGELFEIGIGFQNDAVGFFADKDANGIWEPMLDGIWIYRNGNMVIQNFDKSIFNGKYEELTFVPCE